MKRPFLKNLVIGVAFIALATLTAPVQAATPDEQARDLFVAHRYAEALVIYERLRAESHHPTYLRNIGRCHQMMRQPKPAIAAFEGYLREAPGLGADERTEVEGYIAEMRRLDASSAPLPGAAPPPAPAPVLAAAPPSNAPTPLVATATPTQSSDEGSSIVRKWWFWAGVGALVVASGIVIAVSSGQDDRLPCPSGAVCP